MACTLTNNATGLFVVNAMRRGQNHIGSYQCSSTLVQVKVAFFPENGQHPGEFAEFGLLVDSSSDLKANAVGILVTAALGMIRLKLENRIFSLNK